MRSMVGVVRVLCLLCIAAAHSACTSLHFVTQAAAGQLELAGAARPIPDVLADPKTAPRTRELLSEVVYVKRYARLNGLKVAGNYEKYVELDRDFPIWFVNASHPLAFRPKTFSFPIIGSFPGLAWFDEEDAKDFAAELEREGWDVNIRGVSAFSTGGWFDDPIVWSMLSSSPAAVGFLVNTVIHESVHATVLVKDEQYFNESLASYIADTMTDQYLRARFGPSSPELSMYVDANERSRVRAAELNGVYQALESVYTSKATRAEKLARKREIIDQLVASMRLAKRPNNATLIGFRLYQVGGDEFSSLYGACAQNWRRFLTAVSRVSAEDFGTPQRQDFGPVMAKVAAAGCPHELFPISPETHERWRWRSKQRERIHPRRKARTTVPLASNAAGLPAPRAGDAPPNSP
jgi:predicted aminopeptidase